MIDLYKRIWRITGRSQVLLIALSLVVAVLAAVPLKFQKEIINGLTGTVMTVQTLLMLGAAYLGVLVLRNVLKFALQYKSTIVGEGVVRMIRTRIYTEKLEGADRGTIAEMIASEAEEVGRFAGGAMASPLLQLGTLVSVIGYIAINQPFLALFMIAIVAPQAMIVAGVQPRINDRIANRVKVLRRAVSRTAEQSESASQAVLDDFDEIYETRRKINLFKCSVRLSMNSITALGTAGLLVLGGFLVINGRTDVGTVVAALSGLTRMNEPWRELIAFYRALSIERMQLDLLLSFQSGGTKTTS